MTEDEMAGWHHQLDAHEFGWTLGVGDGQGSLAWRILSITLLACEIAEENGTTEDEMAGWHHQLDGHEFE